MPASGIYLAGEVPGPRPYPRAGPCGDAPSDRGPITSTAKGLSTEVPLGPANGLDQPCLVSCDNIITIDKVALGRHVGYRFERQEGDLTQAIANASALRQ